MRINYSDFKKLGIDFEEDDNEVFESPQYRTMLEEIRAGTIYKTIRSDAYKLSSVIEYGNNVDVITPSNRASGEWFKKIRNLPDNKYVDLETGVIKERKKNETRVQSISNLNKSLSDLRRLIIANFTDCDGLFITLAYDDYMEDYSVAQKDYNRFYNKFKYYCKSKLNIEKLLFIKVVEPKASGSWHFHILVKSENGSKIKISEDRLRKMWGQKSVSVKPIDNAKGLAYYLGNLTVNYKNNFSEDEDYDILDILAKDTYDRRKYYKSGMRLFSSSAGLKRPAVTRMTKAEAMNKVADYEKVYENVKEIRIGEKNDKLVNVITYETYEKKGEHRKAISININGNNS